MGEALEAGLVGLNVGVMACDVAPFGGVKQSGLGREGGTEGIEDFLETKAFNMGGFRYCLAAFSDAKPVSTFAESALAKHIFETVIGPNGR